MTILYQKGAWPPRHHTRTTIRPAISAALDDYIAILDAETAAFVASQPKQLARPTPPIKKETRPMRRTDDDIRTANDMAVLLADMSAKRDQPSQQPSENNGAVQAILKKMQEPPTTQMGGPIEPGHHLYVAPAPTYGDDGEAPVSHGFDPSIQNGMKGWTTLDAARYRNSLPSKFQQEQERLASIRAGMAR
jgi:hypothetical protein